MNSLQNVSVSGTKRVGKSFATLLAEIISSYLSHSYAFFENLHISGDPEKFNYLLRRMIMNNLWRYLTL